MAKGRKRIENLDDLCLTKDEREILRLYYNDSLSWAEVSAKVYYSVRQCQNIRRRAMKKLSDSRAAEKGADKRAAGGEKSAE